MDEQSEDTLKGRMIRRDISRSMGFAALSTEAQLLFCLMIPHFSAHGKMNGSPHYIKGEVVPLLKRFTTQAIDKCLREITEKTSVKWFEKTGVSYIHATRWDEHQDIREDRRGEDEFPDFDPITACTSTSNSTSTSGGSGPGVVRESSGSEHKNYEIKTEAQEVVAAYKIAKGIAVDDRAWDIGNYARSVKTAAQLIKAVGKDGAIAAISGVKAWAGSSGLEWGIETVLKRAADWRAGRLVAKAGGQRRPPPSIPSAKDAMKHIADETARVMQGGTGAGGGL